jgi:hypothetical protein
MKFEELLRDEATAMIEPLLVFQTNTSFLQNAGVTLESANVQDVQRWIGAVRAMSVALRRLSIPTDWSGYIEYAGQLGSLLLDLRDLATADLEGVARHALEFSISYYLRHRRAVVFYVLDLLGLIRVEGDVEDDSAYPFPFFFIDTTKIELLVRSPVSYAQSLWGLDLPTISERRRRLLTFALPRLARIAQALGVDVRSNDAGDTITVRAVVGTTPVGASLSIGENGALGFAFDRQPQIVAQVGSVELQYRSDDAGGSFRIAKASTDPLVPIFTAGIAGTGVVLGGASVRFRYLNGAAGWLLEVDLQRLLVTVGCGTNLDSFSASLSEGAALAAQADLGLRITSEGAFDVTGNGSVGSRIVLNTSIGPVRLRALQLGLRFEGGTLSGFAALDFSGVLGPVAASVVGLGFRVGLSLGSDAFSDMEVYVEARPPNGVGISVNAGPVVGGGFIAYDDALGRYSGALALSIGSIALRAIGILDTRAPGISGYSFLIVISAEFSPIQLGFGFTLMGVGGLCGIQRSISVSALQSGVRDGSLAPLLFSRDPVAQAAQLITGLQRIFPPTNDSYVFGPMFKLGWGTPTLVTVDLGIVLQVPSPIVIVLLGTLSASLPRPEAAIVVLNLDIVGILEVTEKRLSISASLRDSRIAAFALTGDLELRFSWGSDPEFLFSLGGFNPAFRPPPSFPTLRRMSLALGSGANPRLSLASYFAITSNTLQFGARAELYATAMGFTVEGYIEFHALIIFRPFSFRFDFAAGLSLKRGNSLLAAITVTGQLKGPRPWYIKATASITVLFFDVSVEIEKTFGQAAEPELAAPVDVWERLLPALADVRNWSATLPEGRPRGVSTAADRETPPRVRLDPMSQLAVRQKVLPLDRRITKLGEAVIGAPARFRIRAVRAGTGAGGEGGTLLTTDAVNEPFAVAQYQTLTDAERLSSPSFQPMAAGMEALGEAVRAGGNRPAPVQWRTLLLEPRVGENAEAPRDVLARMAGKMGAVDASKDAGLRATGMERFAPPAGAVPTATLEPERWTLASTRDLDARPGAETSAAWGTSTEALRELPVGERGRWQVVPSWEVRR